MKKWICADAAALLAVSMLSGCSGGLDNSSARTQTTQARAGSQTESAEVEEANGNAEIGNTADSGKARVKESEVTGGPSAEELEAAVGTHHVKITVKDYGIIDAALGRDNVSITVASFLKSARDGFYDGLTSHRVMSSFMIQSGDPLGAGMGGSDEEIKGEFAGNGVKNPLSHAGGAISMTRPQIKDSTSSQFFIVYEDSTFLDGEYACFRYVTESVEVVNTICRDIQPVDNNDTVPKENQPVIQNIEVID